MNKKTSEKVVREICRKTRRKYESEESIRVVRKVFEVRNQFLKSAVRKGLPFAGITPGQGVSGSE